MWSIILLLLPVTYAKDPSPQDLIRLLLENQDEPHEVRPIRVEPTRAYFVPPKWSELSEREHRVAVDKLSEDIENVVRLNTPPEPLVKTLIQLLADSDTPSNVLNIAVEGIDRIGAHRLTSKNWEDVVRIAITNPHSAGEIRAKLATTLSREPLKPEQVEFIRTYLNDPKYRDAAMAFLVGLKDRAKPFMDTVRPLLNKDYNAQRVLSHVGGEEAHNFFKKRLDPHGMVDPETVKAFSDKALLKHDELELLAPLLGKRSLGIPARGLVFKAILHSAPLGPFLDQIEKFIEDAFNEGDEDLLLGLDEKFLPMILQRGNLAPERILKIFVKRLPHEQDPLKKAVMLNHLNAFLKNYWGGVTDDKDFLSYLERAAQNTGGKPTKEEFVANLARLQLRNDADFPKIDARLSDYLNTTPNKKRATNQLEQINWEFLTILPATAKILLASQDRTGLGQSRLTQLETLEGVHELYKLAEDREENLTGKKKEELNVAREVLASMTHRYRSALTDEAVVTLAFHGGLSGVHHDRLIALLKSSDKKLADRAFLMAASNPVFLKMVKDDLLEEALLSKNPKIVEAVMEIFYSQGKIEKLAELAESKDEKTRTAAFRKAGAVYDTLLKVPRETASRFLDSNDFDTATLATRRLIAGDAPLTQPELAKVIANIPRNPALASASIWALAENHEQLREVPAEVLKNLAAGSDHYATMDLIKKMGQKAANAVPDLTKLVQPNKFDQYVGKSLLAIGEPAKKAIPALRDLSRRGDAHEKIHAALTLQGFGVDMTSAVPEARKSFYNETHLDLSIASAELLVKLPKYRDEGVRMLLSLRTKYVSDAGIFDAKLKELWNDDVSKSMERLSGDASIAISRSARQFFEDHNFAKSRGEK